MRRLVPICLLLLIPILKGVAQDIILSPQPIGWDAGDLTPYLNLTGYPVLDYSSATNQVGIDVDNVIQAVIITVQRDLNWPDEVELQAILTRNGSGKNSVNEPVGTTVQITTSPIQFLSTNTKVKNAEIQYRLYSYDQLPEAGTFSTTVTYTVQAP